MPRLTRQHLRKDARDTHPTSVYCAVQTWPDTNDRDHHTCDGWGPLVNGVATLTPFWVKLGYSGRSFQLCVRWTPNERLTSPLTSNVP
ncbi:DUF7558 family protein [Halorubrum salsamenti]